MASSKKNITFLKLKGIYNDIVKFLIKKRSFLNESYLEYILIFILFAALTVVYTNFIAFNITSQVFTGGPGDGTAGFLWFNFFDHSLNPILQPTNFVNYPYGEQMGGPTFITYSAIWLPLRFLSYFFGAIAGINFVTMWGFIFAGVCAYWVLKRLTKSIPISLFAGFATAFVPYNIYNSSSHITYIFCAVFVLILAAFIALWLQPTIIRGVIFGFALALAIYTDGYYVLLVIVMLFGLLVAGVMHALLLRYKWLDYWKRTKVLFVAAGCLLVLLIPVFYVQLTQGSQITDTLSASRSDIAGELYAYRSTPEDFVLPPMGNPLLPIMDKNSTVANLQGKHSNAVERATYVGFVIIILSAIGFGMIFVWLINRKHSTLGKIDKDILHKYLLVGSIAFVTIPLFVSFMISPDIYISGHRIPMPGSLLIDLHITLWRVMARFFIPLHVIMVVFAAFTLWIILRYSKTIERIKKYKRIAITLIVMIIIGLTVIEYWTTVNRPSFSFNNQASGYVWLKKQNDINVIAEFPMVDPLDFRTSDYMTSQIYHGKKLVNIKETRDRQQSNTLGDIDNPEAIDFAYSRGTQAIVTHKRKCLNYSWGTVIFKNDKSLASAMCIYKLNKPATIDTSFVLFKNGVNNSVNEKNTNLIFINNFKLSFLVTGIDFIAPGQSGRAAFSTRLDHINKKYINGGWKVTQDDKIVSHGVVSGQQTKISANIDKKLPANIEISFPDDQEAKTDDFVLSNTKVISL